MAKPEEPTIKEYWCDECQCYHKGRPIYHSDSTPYRKPTPNKSLIGKTFENFDFLRGHYTVRDVIKTNDGYLLKVSYIDGNWKGKNVNMSWDTHEKMQTNIDTISKAGQESRKMIADWKLDIWYRDYRPLYEAQWKEGITSVKLVEILEGEYTLPASRVESEVMSYYE